MTRKEYHWYKKTQVMAKCIMSNDYYITNEHQFHQDGSAETAGEVFGYYVITPQYYNRYRLPLMHTETNIKMPMPVDWFYKQWANVHRLKQDAVPILGFTWYSLLHQVDWDTALSEYNATINEPGLYDLDRNLMSLGKACVMNVI